MSMRTKESTRRRSVVLVLIAVAGVVAIGLAGAGVALYTTIRGAGAAERAVHDYFTALQEGHYDNAYELLCPETRSDHPRETFESTVGARPPTAHEMTGELRVDRKPGGTTAEVGVEVSYADGTSEARLVWLVRTGGNWLVCGSPY